MKELLIIMAGAFLVVSAVAGRFSAESAGNASVGLCLSTDKAEYAAGEPVVIVLTVFNHSGREVTFRFTSSKRYDFTIQDENGNEMWRWSEGRMFLMVLGEEVIGPGREEVIYTERYTGELKSGNYQVTGILAAADKAMSGSVTIVVE